jgi:predicted Zn-dependent protease
MNRLGESNSQVVVLNMDEIRVVRRLEQSCGYLELGMAQQALDNLAQMPDAGSFEGAVKYLRGHALRNLGQHRAAIDVLHEAAAKLPPPAVSQAWYLLSQCYRATGQLGLARSFMALARGGDEGLTLDQSDEARRAGS